MSLVQNLLVRGLHRLIVQIDPLLQNLLGSCESLLPILLEPTHPRCHGIAKEAAFGSPDVLVNAIIGIVLLIRRKDEY